MLFNVGLVIDEVNCFVVCYEWIDWMFDWMFVRICEYKICWIVMLWKLLVFKRNYNFNRFKF